MDIGRRQALYLLGGGVGVPATYSLVGIAYNTDLVKTPPASWADLWKPEYRGQVGMGLPSDWGCGGG